MNLAARGAVTGRGHELAVLRQAVSSVAAGRGGVIWVDGPPGIGKTTLIDTALAAAPGITILRAAGDELSAAFPLRMMAECLGVSRRSADPERAALATVLSEHPVSRPWAGLGPDTTLASQMLTVAEEFGRAGPVILAADALQWADEASLELWASLAGLTTRLPLLLLGAARPVLLPAAAAGLPALTRRLGGSRLSLGALAPEAVTALAEHALGTRLGPRLRAELHRAGGVPGYVHLLLDALAGSGLLEVDGETAEFTGDPGTTPEPLAAAIARGLSFLSEEARGTARMAAVLGDGCSVADLAAVTGRPDHALAADLAEATTAGVLVASRAATGDGTWVAFRQELTRQALATQIPPAVSPALHRHAARTLAASGRRLPAVAPHLLAGPAAMEDWALRWLGVRSESSLYQVPQAAAELLETAIRLVDQEDPRWESLAGKLAQASFWLGRDESVIPMALEVARRTGDVDLACRMQIFAMRSAAQVGHYQDGIAIGEAALRDRGLSSAWRARLQAWLAVLLLLSGQSQRGEARAFDALRHAALAADPMATASAHQAAALGAGTAEAMAHTDSALAALGDDPESADLRLSLLHNRLSWLMRLGDEQELERTLALALREAERAGTVGAVAILGAVAHVRYRQGRWDEALALLERIGPEFRSLPRGIRLRAVGSLIASHRGDQAAAAGYLGADGPAAPRLPDSPEPGVSNLVVARALVAEATGDLDQAVAAVASWLARPAPLRRHLDCDDAPDLVRVTLAAGARDTARALVAALEEDAAADPVAGRILAAQCGRAQLAGDPAALVAVAAAYQQFGWPMRRGLALEEAAERYAHAGQRSAARDALTEAAAAYSGPGATWDTRRADARLRPHRVRRGPHSTHRTEATGWAALTPAEAQVALLAVEGMTNADIATRLFVSQRTVEAHVSQILAKLQVRSRAELARAYAQQVPNWGNGR